MWVYAINSGCGIKTQQHTHTHVRSIAESNREEAAEPRAHTHARLKLPIPVFEYFLRYSYPVIGVTRPLLAAMGGCPPLNTTHTHILRMTAIDSPGMCWDPYLWRRVYVLRTLPSWRIYSNNKSNKNNQTYSGASSHNSLGTRQEEEFLEYILRESPY